MALPVGLNRTCWKRQASQACQTVFHFSLPVGLNRTCWKLKRLSTLIKKHMKIHALPVGLNRTCWKLGARLGAKHANESLPVGLNRTCWKREENRPTAFFGRLYPTCWVK